MFHYIIHPETLWVSYLWRRWPMLPKIHSGQSKIHVANTKILYSRAGKYPTFDPPERPQSSSIQAGIANVIFVNLCWAMTCVTQ